MRWQINFSVENAQDHLNQLHALGAILAFPEPDERFRVVRDLKQRPARAEIEDINSINRIFWYDTKPDTVSSLARALGLNLNPMPGVLGGFFPESLERNAFGLS